MAFVPFPTGIQAELRFLLDEQRVENTLWFDAGGTPTTAQLEDVALMLTAWAASDLLSALSNQISLMEVYVTSQASNTAPTYSSTAGMPIPGGIASVAVPNQCALGVTFRTAARGRTARGRNYVAGIPQTKLVSNTWDTTWANDIRAGYGNLIADAATAGVTWCVASKRFNNADRATGLLRPVTSVALVDYIVDSQRRRTPGRGV